MAIPISNNSNKKTSEFSPKFAIGLVLVLGGILFASSKIGNYNPSEVRVQKTLQALEVSLTVTAQVGALFTPTPAPTFTPTPAPTSTSTPEPTLTPVPTSTSTPEPTLTPVPTSTSTPAPTSTSTPVPTSTSTPAILTLVQVLPVGSPVDWCVAVGGVVGVTFPDGLSLPASGDGYVYLSFEALNLPVVVQKNNWFYPFSFPVCGLYR